MAAAGASRPFLRLGVSKGFTYTYDAGPRRARGSRTMWLDGARVEPSRGLLGDGELLPRLGGDNFTALAGGTGKQDTGKSDLQAMVDYLAEFANPAEGDAPLPVDYSQRAVGVVFPTSAPSAYAPGSEVSFGLTSLAMTAAGDLTDASVTVSLDGTQLGTADVTNTVGDPTRDESGTASVSVTLPAGTTGGTKILTVTGANTGTTVLVPDHR